MGNKTILGLIIITLGIFFYFSFVKDPAVPANNELIVREQGSNISAESLGREIIKVLAQIKDLQLDTSIFKNNGYTRLNNLNQEIPVQEPGKSSPFDPIDRSFFNRVILEQRNSSIATEAAEGPIVTEEETVENNN